MWSEGQSAARSQRAGRVTRTRDREGTSPRLSNRAGSAPAPAEAKPEAKPQAAKPKPAPKPAAASEAKPAEPAPAPAAAAPAPQSPARKQIIPAGQPLPPQPSTNEISPEALAKVNEVEKKAKKLTLMELTERTCKWPVGDPATEDFWFCGLPVQQGKPYCEAHVGVAFQPMSARRDRRR